MLKDQWYDDTLAKAAQAFTPEALDAVLQSVHERMVNEAEWIWVVHDVNPRAIAPHVKGFAQAKHWFQDLTPVSIER